MRMITTSYEAPRIIGGAMFLALQSSHHRGQPVDWLMQRWRHSIVNRNFIYVEKTDSANNCTPLHFGCWTFASTEWIEQLRKPDSTLDYFGEGSNDGPYMFFIDLISPNSHPFQLFMTVRALARRRRDTKGIAFIRHRNGQARVHLIQLNQTAG